MCDSVWVNNYHAYLDVHFQFEREKYLRENKIESKCKGKSNRKETIQSISGQNKNRFFLDVIAKSQNKNKNVKTIKIFIVIILLKA